MKELIQAVQRSKSNAIVVRQNHIVAPKTIFERAAVSVVCGNQRPIVQINQHRGMLRIKPLEEHFKSPALRPNGFISIPALELFREDFVVEFTQCVDHVLI